MKQAILLVGAIMLITGPAMADVKIKTKQTMMGNVSENTTYIKGKRSRIELQNAAMVSITQCDLGRDLQINPASKTYLVSHYDDGTIALVQPPADGAAAPVQKGGTMYVTTTIKDTGERKQMFGYTARHIIQTVEMDSSPDACSTAKTKLEMDMWVIDAEFAVSCFQTRQYRSYNPQSIGCVDKIVQKTLGTGKPGYPLWQRMTSYDASGKEQYSMIQEVIELSKTTLDQALFDIPDGYREVKDSTQLYGAAVPGKQYTDPAVPHSNTNPSLPGTSGLGSTLARAAESTSPEPKAIGPKTPGTIRVGLANVETAAVGEGISAADLSTAIKNSLGEFLKGTRIEVVSLDTRLASAQADEARQKECDYIITATASHKKGGGGFGGFGKVFSSVAPIVPMAASSGGYLASHVVSSVVTAASVEGSVKKKDEITLDLKVFSSSDNSSALAKQFKTKAESDGDDVISTIVEQATQAIIDAIAK